MTRAIAAASLLLLLTTGCKGDPNTPEYWKKAIDGAHKTKDKVRVIDELRSSKALNASFTPMLAKELETAKAGDVRGAIARAFGDLKDPASVEPLMSAIDLSASESDEKAANKEIVLALGTIGDKKAAPAMMKALNVKDNFTAIAAIEGLGHIRANEAVDKLIEMATADSAEPFIAKKAIQALGEIGDKKAVPGLVKMMVKERRGVSFYPEASFALFQIGQPAADAVVAAVNGDDKELIDWMKQYSVLREAIEAKGAQVLGDFHDQRANKKMMEMLKYEREEIDIKLFVRMRAADALGRNRVKEAAKQLGTMLDETEANARHEYTTALTRIGGKDAIPSLEKTSIKGPWDAREQSIRALGLIGDEKSSAVLEKLLKDEVALYTAECKEDDGQAACKTPEESAKGHLTIIQGAIKSIAAAKGCTDVACWSKLLDDADFGIRQRAALELGHSGKADAVEPLLKHLRESNLETRLTEMISIDWLITDSKEAGTKAHAFQADVDKQLADEKGKTEFVKVNEDLKRLAWKIDHAG